jgi:ankyrin repeat protein
VDTAMNDGCTPLFISAQNGFTEVVKLLVEGGADATIAFQGKYTPLFIAKQNGHQAIVALLQ